MEDKMQDQTPDVRPRRRRKRTRLDIIKEQYLPYLILALAAVVIVTLCVGKIRRTVQVQKANQAAAEAESQAAAQLEAQEKEQAAQLLTQSAALAEAYDFDGAIAALDSFTGDISKYPELLTKQAEYVQSKSQMVAWDDPSKIPNLSFQLLIADPARAFADDIYGDAYNRNYVTTDEFSKILQQLYDNGYMLVSLSDLVTEDAAGEGTGFSAATLYLPQGKKPLVLTQCAVNYFTYMTDGDGDGLPDKDGDGFASRLVVDSNGKIVNEMVDAQGNLITGAFDLVPILDNFLEEHPDFSYHGAKATLAVTGYDGIFGYRIDSTAKTAENTEYYNQQIEGAKAIVQALRDDGYELACYTYEHFGYGDETADRISQDLTSWKNEIVPVLGSVDILVYPFGSDIAENRADAYSGDRYNVLKEAGFRYFIGMDNTVSSWADVQSGYFRQTRKLVTGAYMTYSSSMFDGLFDSASVLNTQRGTVPQQ